MDTELALADRVTAGAKWLDRHYSGWHGHVNTFVLDMADGDKCILGQVGRAVINPDHLPPHMVGFSKYVQLLDTHNVEWSFPADHGFCWEWHDGEPFPDEAYKVWIRQVTLLWISEVNSRIAADPVPVAA